MALARQVLRVLLGDEVLWFEPQVGGYKLTAETRFGPPFKSHGAQELSRGSLSIRAWSAAGRSRGRFGRLLCGIALDSSGQGRRPGARPGLPNRIVEYKH